MERAGDAVTNFNLAANRRSTDSSGQVVKETTWFRISAWGKTAENCIQYLHKGSLVLLEGRLVCDPETGGPRLYTRKVQTGLTLVSFQSLLFSELSPFCFSTERDPSFPGERAPNCGQRIGFKNMDSKAKGECLKSIGIHDR